MMSERPNRPAHLPFDASRIPHELAALDQWVCWKFKWIDGKDGRPGKWTKIPVDPKTGRGASSTDAATWGTFEEACAYADRWLSEDGGIGFVFTDNDPYTGVDFDHCRNAETGAIDPAVFERVTALNSLTEISASGTGLHVIIKAKRSGRNKKGPFECYSTGRYFTFTGHVLDGFTTIRARQDAFNALHGAVFVEKPAPAPIRPRASNPVTRDLDVIIKRVSKTRKGDALHRLGDIAGYPSQSEAELALLNLYQAAGADMSQADAIMRCSALFRPEKWDSKRGASTYGEQTIAKSFDGSVKLWDDPVEKTATITVGPKPHDAGLVASDDIAELKLIILDLTKRLDLAEARAAKAEARADMLSEVQSKATSIIRNNKLGQERFTAIALAYRFGNRESTGDLGDDGLYRFKLRDVAREAGISEDTAAAHIAKLQKSGVLRKENKWCPDETWIDVSTGEMHTGVKGQFLGPVGNVTNFIEAVARLVPEEKKTWGGRADRVKPCAKHPDANIIKTTVWACEECGDVLYREKEIEAPKPHDAGLVDEDLAATGTDGPTPGNRAPLNSRGLRPQRDRNGPTSHNTIRGFDAPAGTVAHAWANAQPVPSSRSAPSGEPGFDRYTG